MYASSYIIDTQYFALSPLTKLFAFDTVYVLLLIQGMSGEQSVVS